MIKKQIFREKRHKNTYNLTLELEMSVWIYEFFSLLEKFFLSLQKNRAYSRPCTRVFEATS